MSPVRPDPQQHAETPSGRERDIAELVDRELKQCLDRAAEGLHWVGPDGTILWPTYSSRE